MNTEDPAEHGPHAVAVTPGQKAGRWGVPLAIVLGVTGVLAAGQTLVRRAAARTNHVALALAPMAVTVTVAREAMWRPTRRYIGTLEPWVQAHIGPQLVSAYVSTVLVRPGAVVHRGDVLATLDCRETSAASQAVAQQARAIESHQAALAREAARLHGLLPGNYVAANEVDQREAERDAEQSRLLATRAQLAGVSLAVGDCVLRAPFDGEVGSRSVDPGAFARPGTEMVSLIDRSVIRVTGDVPEVDFDTVAPGVPVRLHMLATGETVPGVVARRSPSADAATRTVHIEIDLPDPQRRLPVNTTAEIFVDVGAPVRATEVPLNAADVRGARASVWVVESDVAHTRRVPVLGERGGSLFVGPVLVPGTLVVTEGRALLTDGDRVSSSVVRTPTAGDPGAQP